MKLYGDFKKQDWMEAIKMEEKSIPSSFILHGELEHEWNIATWRKILSGARWFPNLNVLIGDYGENRLGFSNVYGGSQVSIVAHRFAAMGTDKFIQTGYFGGLSNQVKPGDIFIVTGAYMEDGISHWYLPGQKFVEADGQLVEASIRYCEERGYTYVTGPIITTGTFMMETAEIVEGWSEAGYLGVDMETSATFAIAKSFGKRAIGLLNLTDHIISGQTFYNGNEKSKKIEEETDKRIRELALYLAGLS